MLHVGKTLNDETQKRLPKKDNLIYKKLLILVTQELNEASKSELYKAIFYFLPGF